MSMFSASINFRLVCFVYPASVSCVSHSIDICTVAIKNIRHMHAVTSNQIADVVHFNDNTPYGTLH